MRNQKGITDMAEKWNRNFINGEDFMPIFFHSGDVESS